MRPAFLFLILSIALLSGCDSDEPPTNERPPADASAATLISAEGQEACALDRDRTYILMGGDSLDTKRQLMQRILDRL